ncbi:MAG: lysophospholipid acyltransferase family protein [Desulfoplanes sp.]|nr:lysophospholipid acyltransferase family protein [Desulfoplanes sp.]
MHVPEVKDSYFSPVIKVSLLGKLFPSLCFYVRDFVQIGRVYSLIKRQALTLEKFADCSYGVARALESVGCRISVENASALDRVGGPCVIVANHMSTLETFVLPWIVLQHVPMTFVVKKGLLKIPFFGVVTAGWDPIAVGRTNPREDLVCVLKEGQGRLDRGIAVVVFPQSTRMLTFTPAQFNTIGVKLARRAKVPVVPLALKTDAWANGKRLKDFGPIDASKTIRFCFGEPMEVTGNGRAEHEKCVDFVQRKLEEWGNR